MYLGAYDSQNEQQVLTQAALTGLSVIETEHISVRMKLNS
jgi:hypothetical protein